MGTRTWFVFTLYCVAGLAAQNNYYLPQAADGLTPSGSIRTAIVVVNHSATTSANITITGTRDDASATTLSTPSTATLPPGATRIYMTDGSGDGTTSAIQVTSDIAVGVSGIVSNTDSNGTVLSETHAPAISADQLASEYLIGVDTRGSLNTAVALYNPSSNAALITVTLMDSTGATVDSATITLAPGNHTARFVEGDLFPALGDFQGSMDVASTGANVAASAVRQRAGSTAFTLLPAVSRLSHQVRFLFPQVFDGPAPEGTLQTAFILTNLSVNPATPSLSLTMDDGVPMAVNVLGVGQSIPPGGTLFLQTDGLSAALASGAATILSDQPLAATAVLTTSDSSGTVLAESGIAPSASAWQFRIPFDPSSGVNAGAAFVNSGARPITLTLTLLDDSGASLATVQSSPLPAHGRLTGAISDFFPGMGTSAGSIIVSTGTPVDLSLAAFSLRQASMARSTAPALVIPIAPTGTPSTVKPVLDSTRSISGNISTTGGALTVTDAKGNKFTLTIPQGALLDRETITMTAITSATGISGPGLTAGVQLSPDGLGLLQPALLKIDLASPPPAGTFPIGWRGTSPGLYLNAPLRDTSSLTLALTHFSGAGVGGFDLTSDLISIANQLDLVNSAASYWISQARFDALSGDEDASAIDGQKLLETLDIGLDTVLMPMMELAMASDDSDAMRCAVTLALAAVRQLELLGAADDDPHVAAATDFINYVFQRMVSKIKTRCDRHDFSAFFEAMGAVRQGLLMGLPVDIDPTSCPPTLELDYTSEMKGDIPVGVTGSYDATISGKVMLTGSFTKDMLTLVTDPSKDLFTSFTLSGSAQESYDSMNYVINGVPAGCSYSVSAKTPATMTVKAGQDPQLSQVQFKFDSHYDPQALTANGQQLCSFCPVYQKTPVKAAVWMDPGKPSETLLLTCPGGSQSVQMFSWWTAWVTNHAQAGDNGFIENWDLVNTPSVFAQKSIDTSITGPGGIKLSEKTSLMLKPVSGQ